MIMSQKVSGTLAEWKDTDLRYTHLGEKCRNYAVNMEFKAYDEEGHLVDPSMLDEVFYPGVFVQADVRLKL